MNETASAEVAHVETRVRCHLGGMVRHLRLVVRDHGIVLQGRARTYYAKQLAQHAVMRETALSILENEIEVS